MSSFILTSCREEKKKSQESVTLSFICQDTGNSSPHRGRLAFAQKLEEISGGVIKAELIYLTKNSSSAEMFDMISSGQFDIAATPFSDIAHIIPELEIVGVPHLIRDYEHFCKMMDLSYGKIIRAEFENRDTILADYWYVGKRQVTSNKPIYSLADFKGLKFRIPNSETMIDIVRRLGVQPVVKSLQQTYEAIEEGKVDAQENPLNIIEAAKLYKVQKYLAITDHLLTIVPMVINKKKYESLTDEQKAWLSEAAHHGRQICVNLVINQETVLLDKFEKEYNMTITYPNQSELKNVMADYYAEVETRFGTKLMDEIQKIK